MNECLQVEWRLVTTTVARNVYGTIANIYLLLNEKINLYKSALTKGVISLCYGGICSCKSLHNLEFALRRGCCNDK